MALSGLRDMSVIDEPPQERYPVQTYVAEHNQALINTAITREVNRGGQVFYIHNRVETITNCASKLKEMFPNARIAYAHGQMTQEQISDIWSDMVDGEIDVLVCTTIVEIGVDIQNANTLIIENADRFGLAQLYQLRGRVGRGNKRAYAYFTFRRDKQLSEVAAKRLEAIKEFTRFGSGYKIAMRDLQIRGAGNILSAQQHGHLESVGYDMYMKMLNTAIAEEKGELPDNFTDCALDIQAQAHIPETYIETVAGRFEIYRKIAKLKTSAEAEDLLGEVKDRYGKPPEAIKGLIKVSLARNKAAALGITEVSQRDNFLVLCVKELSEKQITALLKKYPKRLLFDPPPKPAVKIKVKSLNENPEPLTLLDEVLTVLQDEKTSKK
jgi:transcription-repair coupling factor (superfamily II helicase)